MRIGLSLFLFVALQGSFLQAADWAGVWRITRTSQGQLEGYHHILIPGENLEDVVVYNSDARPMRLQSAAVDGEKLKIQFVYAARKTLPLQFELVRDGERISGKWIFFQGQYKVTGELEGLRIMEAERWKPFQGLAEQRPGTYIDINNLFFGEPTLPDFDEFLRLWDSEIEPVYYFLFQDWLYSDPASQRSKRLRHYYDSLRGKGVRPLSQRFPVLVKAVGEKISQYRGGPPPGLFWVNAFSPRSAELDFWTRPMTPTEQKCECKLDLFERFVPISPDSYLDQPELAELLMTRDLLTSGLWKQPPPHPIISLYRNGLALTVAAQLLDLPLPQADLEGLKSIRQAAQTQLGASEPDVVALFPQDAPVLERGGTLLALDFIRQLSLGRSWEEIARLAEAEVMRELTQYLE